MPNVVLIPDAQCESNPMRMEPDPQFGAWGRKCKSEPRSATRKSSRTSKWKDKESTLIDGSKAYGKEPCIIMALQRL